MTDTGGEAAPEQPQPVERPSLRLSEAAIRFGIPEPALRERVEAGRVEGYRDAHGSWCVYLDEHGRPAEPAPAQPQRRTRRGLTATAGPSSGPAAEPAPSRLPRPVLLALGVLYDLSARYPTGFQVVIRLLIVGLFAAIAARFLYVEPGLPDNPLRLDFMLIGICVVPLAIWEVIAPLDAQAARDRPEYKIVLYALGLSAVAVPVAITFRLILGLFLD